jgi:hypothetical protein
MRDESSSHAIVLTNQTAPIPNFILRAIDVSGGKLHSLPHQDSFQERAGFLRCASREFDRVVLHHHPHDLIPVLAFAQEGGRPVAMFNHAHFSFCLGATVSDIVINPAEYFRRISEQHRYARRTGMLTGVSGLRPLPSHAIDKEAARRELNMAPDLPVAMSIGSEPYFCPIEGYDFFHTASRLLKAHPALHLLVVGVPSESPLIPPALRSEARFRCVGPVVNPTPYYQAADLCLESFPMPSLGAFVEAVAYGEAFPVPVYGIGESALRVQYTPLFTLPYRPKDEDDYVSYVGRLLRAREETRAAAREMRLGIIRFDDGWSDRLRDVNQSIDCLKHQPAEIPVSPVVDTADTRELARLNKLDFGEELDRLLPLGEAVRSYFVAAGKGVMTPGQVAKQIARRIKRSVY